MLGRAPILDFDGTLVNLDVDWGGLRDTLAVERIDDLWDQPETGWSVVANAEMRAASKAPGVAVVLDRLSKVRCFAVLTSNTSDAVHCFVNRFPILKEKLAFVVGRDELGGPKTEFAFFKLGVQACLRATEQLRGRDSAVYVGDAPYELEFASRLGLIAVDVRKLVKLKPSI
jgi:phosphoglycolate phosphatase-like HAD superfamily hydrolase